MSEIAGRLAPQIGAYFLERMSGGKGKLMGGATGVKPANVVILGAGIAGSNAAIIAIGHGSAHQGARHRPGARWAACAGLCPAVETLHSDQLTIEAEVAAADVVIGAVLVSGARTPVLVSEDTGAFHAAGVGHRGPQHRPGRHGRHLAAPRRIGPRPS